MKGQNTRNQRLKSNCPVIVDQWVISSAEHRLAKYIATVALVAVQVHPLGRLRFVFAGRFPLAHGDDDVG